MIRSKYVTLAATAALSLGMFSVLSGHSITSAVEIDGVRYEGSVQGSNVVGNLQQTAASAIKDATDKKGGG